MCAHRLAVVQIRMFRQHDTWGPIKGFYDGYNMTNTTMLTTHTDGTIVQTSIISPIDGDEEQATADVPWIVLTSRFARPTLVPSTFDLGASVMYALLVALDTPYAGVYGLEVFLETAPGRLEMLTVYPRFPRTYSPPIFNT